MAVSNLLPTFAMSNRREKAKAKTSQLNKQLAELEYIHELKEQEKAYYLKLGDFLLDVAKLVFGGIILTGIIDFKLDKVTLFVAGITFVLTFSVWGFAIYRRGIRIRTN